jgi:glycerol-3-phosphate dehydrogenase
VSRILGRPTSARTADLTLDGGDVEVRHLEAHTWLDVSDEVATGGLAAETLETLVALYGRNYRRVMELAGKVPGGAERLCPSNPDVVAQLHHGVHEELTVSLQDVLLRRTGIGTSRCQGRDCADPIARRLALLLGWSGRRLDAELEAYQSHVARSQRFRA